MCVDNMIHSVLIPYNTITVYLNWRLRNRTFFLTSWGRILNENLVHSSNNLTVVWTSKLFHIRL